MARVRLQLAGNKCSTKTHLQYAFKIVVDCFEMMPTSPQAMLFKSMGFLVSMLNLCRFFFWGFCRAAVLRSKTTSPCSDFNCFPSNNLSFALCKNSSMTGC
jgi:hypothetical protein